MRLVWNSSANILTALRLCGAAVLVMCIANVSAADVGVIGVFGNKATLVINGGRPVTMSVGDSTPDKIRLISVSGESAVVEIEGKRRTLQLGERISTAGASGGAARATLTADGRGHFVANVVINGVSMSFLVDTGATLVTMSSDNARRAGINYVAGERGMMQTANGVAAAYRVKLDSVRLGDITLNNVDGVVIEGNRLGAHGLLGMSFLNRTEMRRDGDTMTLTRRF